MKYMLLVYGPEEAWTEEERHQCMVKSMALCEELAAEGKFIDSSPLRPVSTATTLRIRQGKKNLTDGPFAETKEQLGGFYLIDVESREEAIAVAERLPPASVGSIEIRPLETLPEKDRL